jgi:glycerate dehydrogenase
MNIVILDGYTVNPGDNPFDGLKQFGDLTVYDRTPADLIIERAQGAEIVLTNKTPLSATTIAALPSLRFIGELATGYDNIDIAAAGRRGIVVANVPGYSTESVAQHAIALMLELSNHAAIHDSAVKAGEWCESLDFCLCKAPVMELAGKKLGIVGFGTIGAKVGAIGFALGMEILAFNPNRKNLLSPFPVRWLELNQLFGEADVVSLHCPLSAENRGFVNADVLASMKKSAFLINTARGALINEADLGFALNNGTIAGAAVDVVSREPITSENPLLFASNCIITPHIAWASLEARQRLVKIVTANVAFFLAEKPVNVVNATLLSEH